MNFKESDGDKDIQKYKRILESDRIDMKTLRSMAWRGIPSQYRAVTWKLLLVQKDERVVSYRAIFPLFEAVNKQSSRESVVNIWSIFLVYSMLMTLNVQKTN